MRIERLSGIGWLILVAAPAPGQEQAIAIGLENAHLVPFTVLAQAKDTAARIYDGIGVKLKWSSGAKTVIWMRFDKGAAATVHPGALGYAEPYGKTGTRIHVLIDRLDDTGSRRLAGALLGHVMAHELGHVLEGLSRHADSGVMKARWDDADFDQMLIRPLPFSASDMEWIQAGVARLESSKAVKSTAERR
jgi:hypothetical protein